MVGEPLARAYPLPSAYDSTRQEGVWVPNLPITLRIPVGVFPRVSSRTVEAGSQTEVGRLMRELNEGSGESSRQGKTK